MIITPGCDFLAARGWRDSAQRGREQSPAWHGAHGAHGPLPTNFVAHPEISPQGTAKKTLAQCFQNIRQITRVTQIYPPASPLAPRTSNHPALSVSPGLGRLPRSQARLPPAAPSLHLSLGDLSKMHISSCRSQQISLCFPRAFRTQATLLQMDRWTLRGSCLATPLRPFTEAKRAYPPRPSWLLHAQSLPGPSLWPDALPTPA